MTEGNPLSRKINKILEMRLESDRELVEALKSLSSFFGENSLRNRKNLKSVIERRGLNINKEFLNDFNILKDQIESIRSDVENMNACCTDMTERLKRAKGQTQSLISNTSELRKEGKRIEMCEEAAASFIKKFQLTPTQERVLKAAPTEPLDDDFFAALARVQEIHSKVKILVRSNQQTAGLEIMEEMALYQEKGFERLYRWSQSQTRSLTQEEIEVSMSLQRGMAALSERPILLRYTLDEYAIARKSTIVRGFIDGLTRGTRSQKPIELHSHDPLRYVGDMVAWIHQTSAGERENLTQLIKKCPEHLVQDHKREIMKKIMEGVCRPLKMRVEQILVSEPGPVTLYKLSNLLQFYTQTIQNIIFCHTSETTEGTSSEKPEYDILETLEELSELCKKMFFNSLSFMSQKFTANISKPPLDLSCNQTLKSSLILLKEILSVQDGSILTIENKRNDFNKVLNLILDPLLQNCLLSASNLSMSDMAVYMINSLLSINNTLAFYELGVGQRLEMLQAQIDAHSETLQNEQAAFVLTRGGLGNIYSICEKYKEGDDLKNNTGMDGESVQSGILLSPTHINFILIHLSYII